MTDDGYSMPERQTKGERKEWSTLAEAKSDPRDGAPPRTWGSVEKTEPTPGFGAGMHKDETVMADAEDQQNDSAVAREGAVRPGQLATFSFGTYGNSRKSPSR